MNKTVAKCVFYGEGKPSVSLPDIRVGDEECTAHSRRDKAASRKTKESNAMANRSRETTKLVLTDHAGLGRIQVELEAFFDFSFALAEDLQDLVDEWAHQIAPRAISLKRNKKPLPR